ncbi:DUF1281 domain-containing protein [Scandinavium manionii]|uniref:DUF1281 domain-containing protein n=1 Tax=Scandinavium manionii TaxID=2926520 RepID=UPI002165E95B|nr:DUF1281 domain-containing protein [Scandinavium manionii]MCS2164479.1 DUF1281 domain-containing protein [Scandinavium manionii]
MPDWCANRIRITVPACLQADLEAWVSGAEYPYYKHAINQSIRLFIAVVAGWLKPAIEMYYLPYPALTANGWTEPSEAALALVRGSPYLGEMRGLIKPAVTLSTKCYRTTGIAGLTWDAPWAPPVEPVMEALSGRWGCTIDHWFSDAGSDFCSYRRYEEGVW